MAEAPESRTQPSRSTRETTGFEDREGHRAPFASSLSEGLRPSDSPTHALAPTCARAVLRCGAPVGGSFVWLASLHSLAAFSDHTARIASLARYRRPNV